MASESIRVICVICGPQNPSRTGSGPGGSLKSRNARRRPVAAPIRALLRQAIDYAGLFPPAGLDLPTAVANYLEYRDGPDAWALGRFVIRAVDLPALNDVSGAMFPLTVLLGPSIEDDLGLVATRQGAVQAVELKGPVPILERVPPSWPRYLEVPIDGDLDATLEAIQARGGFAKVRTGGLVPEAIPDPGALARFLVGAARLRLAFKATAGLHHPMRGSYRLTYQPDAPRGTMFGYLNLALAAGIAWSTGDLPATEAALVEGEAGAIHRDADGLRWREHRFSTGMIAGLRRDFFHGFGSCSFREPLDELPGLGPVR